MQDDAHAHDMKCLMHAYHLGCYRQPQLFIYHMVLVIEILQAEK
jgi:hypothetical protein